jgi:hAT family C-terminal dimerisation region
MASSVSSERAFSSAGITLTKRRNRLKGDIVEALQFMKCLFHQDLLFREVCTVAEEELILDAALNPGDDAKSDDAAVNAEPGPEGSSSWEDLYVAENIAESDTEIN